MKIKKNDFVKHQLLILLSQEKQLPILKIIKDAIDNQTLLI